MNSIDKINEAIKGVDSNMVSDGHHTFGELYEHRIVNYIALCKQLSCLTTSVWMSLFHSDESSFDGYFVLGINKEKGTQITYHLPLTYWDECLKFAEELDKAPEFDGHTSADVLTRISSL